MNALGDMTGQLDGPGGGPVLIDCGDSDDVLAAGLVAEHAIVDRDPDGSRTAYTSESRRPPLSRD